MAFPNVRLSNRPLHFIYLCDCSGSMAAQGKMQALNQAIRQSLPGMAEVARENPEARVLVRAVRFADQAAWHLAEPTPVQHLQWRDLEAGGITAMGDAVFRRLRNGRVARLFAGGCMLASDLGLGGGYSVKTLA